MPKLESFRHLIEIRHAGTESCQGICEPVFFDRPAPACRCLPAAFGNRHFIGIALADERRSDSEPTRAQCASLHPVDQRPGDTVNQPVKAVPPLWILGLPM